MTNPLLTARQTGHAGSEKGPGQRINSCKALKNAPPGRLVGSIVKRLPSTQVKPASPSPTHPACVPSLVVSLSNK